MATQSPKTRKTNNTKKPVAKAKTAAKKPVKAAAKPAKKAAAAASGPKSSGRFSRVLRRNRAAGASKARAKVSSVALNAWNKWLALLFAVQGLLVLLLSEAHSLPVVGQYLALDTFASQGDNEVRATAQQHLFDVNIAYWLAGVSFVFALGHLLAATALRKRYDAGIAAKNSNLRWAVFGLGYGGLAVLFGLLIGIQDVASLAVGFLLVIALCVLAVNAEVLGATKGLRGLLVAGFALGWAVLGYYLLNAWLYDGSVPAYLYALLGVTFLLSLQVARIFTLQQKGAGKWADYVYAERAYMVWTFVLVAAATWQIFLGILEP